MKIALIETQTLRAAYSGGVRPASLYTKFEADCSIRSKVRLLRGPKISKLVHVTQATPFMGRFIFHTQAGSVLHLCTKYEADCSIRSNVIKGVPKLGN